MPLTKVIGKALAVLLCITLALPAPHARAEDQNVRIVGQIGGDRGLFSGAVKVHGNYCYLGEGSNLTVLDAASSSPVPVAYFPLPGVLEDICIADDLAYLACTTAGLQIVNVSNPSTPTLVGSYKTSARCVFVLGHHAYVAAGSRGLQIFDVADPSSPTLVGSYDTPGPGLRVHVSGSLACVADGTSGGLQIIDVSNPAHPVFRGSYRSGYPPYEREALDVVTSGSLAYVGIDGSLEVVDLSDPTSPTRLGRYVNLMPLGFACDLDLVGQTVYAGWFWDGVNIIDVSDPSDPRLLGQFNGGGQATRGVSYSGGLVYAATCDDLAVYDARDPSRPIYVAGYVPLSAARDVFVSNTRAYVVNNFGYYWGGLQIVAAANPQRPRILGMCARDSDALRVFIASDLAYVADYGRLEVFDVSHPPGLTRLADYGEYSDDVCVVNNLAYVCGYRRSVAQHGLKVIDVSDPSSPTLRGFCPTPGSTVAVFVSGRYAYVAVGAAGLTVVDVVNPSSPTVCGQLAISGRSCDVFVAGDRAYVAATITGLHVVDVHNPASPMLRSSFDTSGTAYSVYVSDSLAYVADGEGGLVVVDVSNPDRPRATGSFAVTRGEARSVFVDAGLIYIAAGSGGLWILEYTGHQPSSARRWALYGNAGQ